MLNEYNACIKKQNLHKTIKRRGKCAWCKILEEWLLYFIFVPDKISSLIWEESRIALRSPQSCRVRILSMELVTKDTISASIQKPSHVYLLPGWICHFTGINSLSQRSTEDPLETYVATPEIIWDESNQVRARDWLYAEPGDGKTSVRAVELDVRNGGTCYEYL